DPAAGERLAAELGVRVAASNQDVVETCDFVVLAVKPQVLGAVLGDLVEAFAENRPVVVSIAAGQTLARLEGLLPPGLTVIRVMPNVNAMIGEGMAAVCGNAHATEADVARVLDIFSSVGQAIQLAEKDFSIFTAVAASGPAFAFTFIDALSRAAVRHGIPKALAVRIAAQTVLGSARLVLERAADGLTPADLADMVSSPAGTTIAGLVAAEDAGFSPAVVRAVDATVARDRELGAL
ncbi:MAG: pyrroline-5-carboxylate reductase, partial [Actinomycetota bacterium]